MNEVNFVQRLNWLVTGDNFLAEKEIPLTAVLDASSYQSVLSQPAGGVAATGTITFAGNPADRDALTIGDKTYHFDATTLNDEPGQVLIGAAATNTADNLVAAITAGAGAGTTYGTGTAAHAAVTASNAAGVVTITASAVGFHGNEISLGPAHLEVEGADSGVANTTFAAMSGGSGYPADATLVPTVAQDGLQFDDGETALLRFSIPQDYAQNADRAALRLHVIATGTNGTTDIGVTTAQRIFRDASAVITTARTAVAETAVSQATAREVILDLTASGYRPGDMVTLTLDVNASSTDELVLMGIDFIYGSVLAAYNDDDRRRDLA
jgi:hypothetical protein